MKWTLCSCGGRELNKIQRTWWMRILFPYRRLYRCARCTEHLFLSLRR
jgi:hypothetical protein